jgi:hypothetical protein
MPNTFCLRGTMMRFGREVCNARIDPAGCAACRCTGYGASGYPCTSARRDACGDKRGPRTIDLRRSLVVERPIAGSKPDASETAMAAGWAVSPRLPPQLATSGPAAG